MNQIIIVAFKLIEKKTIFTNKEIKVKLHTHS